jgi:voltage-gated potassium channel
MTAPAHPTRTPRTPWRRFRVQLRSLYHGQSPQSVRFRLAIIVVDLALIGFFIAAPLMRDAPYFLALDYFCAAVLACDMAARALAFRSIPAFLKRPIVWADLFVLATLLAPQLAFNLGFLRVLRLWTLFHSEFFWATIGRRYDDTRVEDVTRAGVTLLTFLFIITGFVYTSFAGRHAGIDGYVDALYFTVATLTTTGFGDIVLPGTWGKLVSIATMICGITLFVRLAQALFRPHKVKFTCPSCALMEHDPDAVHCKACGTMLNIPNNEA